MRLGVFWDNRQAMARTYGVKDKRSSTITPRILIEDLSLIIKETGWTGVTTNHLRIGIGPVG